MARRYRIVISYDGTNYAGWQVQPGKRTVQSEIERALKKVTGQKCRVHCSGRTDRGVHARAQVAHFDLPDDVDVGRLMSGMNALLDEDIRLLSLRRAKSDFHARYSARKKEYRYMIWNGPVVPPFVRQFRAHVKIPLSVEAMAKAASQLKGRHDFAAFSANPNREVDGTFRKLEVLYVRRHGNEIVIIARGDGFLYKMVRSLAGFLIRVGSGALEPSEAKSILATGERTARVPTAPALGLFLWRVYY